MEFNCINKIGDSKNIVTFTQPCSLDYNALVYYNPSMYLAFITPLLDTSVTNCQSGFVGPQVKDI